MYGSFRYLSFTLYFLVHIIVLISVFVDCDLTFVKLHLYIAWLLTLNNVLFTRTQYHFYPEKNGKTIWPAHPVVFPKMYFSERRSIVAFCDFYYHKPHLSWKFHWNSSSRSEDMKVSFFNIKGLRACNFIRKKLQRRHFFEKFSKFLRTQILRNVCEGLLLSTVNLLWISIYLVKMAMIMIKLTNSA